MKQENIQQSQLTPEKRPGEKRGLHCRKMSSQMLLSPRSFSHGIENKAWILPFHAQERRPNECTHRKRRRPLYKRFSFDDAWMERSRKRKLVKETQSDREIEPNNLQEDQVKVRNPNCHVFVFWLPLSFPAVLLTSSVSFCESNHVCSQVYIEWFTNELVSLEREVSVAFVLSLVLCTWSI